MSQALSISQLLNAIHIKSGTTLVVGSDIMELGLFAQEHHVAFDLDELIDGLFDKIGPQGTLLFPTFSFDFCEQKCFDRRSTPSVTGALSRRALARGDFKRTKHPVYSFAVKGLHTDELCHLKNKSGCGLGSPFQFMHEQNGVMLVINKPFNHVFTFVHYPEEIEQVPYRYVKEFTGPYIDLDGSESKKTISLYVRDIDAGVESDVLPLERELIRTGIAKEIVMNNSRFVQIKLAAAYDLIVRDIRSNHGKLLHRIN